MSPLPRSAAEQKISTLLEQRIPSFRPSGEISLKLERIEWLLQRVGNPERSYPTIHIAGTSGKGSVAAMTASVLTHHGLRVGLHLSPAIANVGEGWQIDGQPYDVTHVAPLMEELDHVACDISNELPFGELSHFELMVATALTLFARQKVDVAVIEVGVGGRLDATNVVPAHIAVITNIGLDHTDLLGSTLTEIASEKAGILKEGGYVLTGATQDSVRRTLERRAHSVNAHLAYIDDLVEWDFPSNDTASLSLCGTSPVLTIHLPTMAPFEQRNAGLAVVAAHHHLGALNPNSTRAALGAVTLPARCEEGRMGGARVIVDGAHNPDKMNATLTALHTHYPDIQTWVIVVALKEGKDIADTLRPLLGISVAMIATTFSSPLWKCLDASDIAHHLTTINPASPVFVEDNPRHALDVAYEQWQSHDPHSCAILVTGSLYLCAQLRPTLIDPATPVLSYHLDPS